ncbi:MAG: sigma-70 family RNA polymerase sigma factor [Eubacteriales bacterium]|nr:sigma-70 family RNA polymerase sigma factor [Eubacteriales bacterium]
MNPLSGDTKSIVIQIQAGDIALREQFITSSLTFIKHAVAQITHTFFVEQTDEFEIALESFNVALDHYKSDSTASFETFAYLVMRNRIFDWLRKQQKNARTISLSAQDPENGLALEEKIADPQSERVQQNLEFAEEMINLELHLQEFGLDLPNITHHFPKHQDCRCLCLRIARLIVSDTSFYQQLNQSHHLPGKALSLRSHIPVKTIEKNRASIIFLTLLMTGSFETIQGYLTAFERGCPQ